MGNIVIGGNTNNGKKSFKQKSRHCRCPTDDLAPISSIIVIKLFFLNKIYTKIVIIKISHKIYFLYLYSF